MNKITTIDIPNKRYFTIGKAANICRLKPHVLRYWEKEFVQLKPATRTGNHRYYTQADLLLILKIKDLLYDQGYTIEGAKNNLATATSSEGTVVISSKVSDAIARAIKKLESLAEGLVDPV